METNLTLMQKTGMRIYLNREYSESKITPVCNRSDFDKAILPSKKRGLGGNAKNIINWMPMDEDWKRRCKNYFWYQDTLEEMKKLHPKMDERLFDLKQILLSFGGEATCLPGYEDDLSEILKYGQLWLGTNIKMMKGVPSQCHRNSCDLWEQNKENTRICTGYALSDDGMWRQHSWVIWMKPNSNQIVETTVPRIAYFGFVMTTEQCEKFAYDNF